MPAKARARAATRAVEAGVRKPADPMAQQVGDEGLADPAEGQAAERDAELHGGEKVAEVLLQFFDEEGAGVAGVNKLLHTGGPHADQRQLGGHKEAVGEDEHDNRRAMKEEKL